MLVFGFEAGVGEKSLIKGGGSRSANLDFPFASLATGLGHALESNPHSAPATGNRRVWYLVL